MSFFRLPVRARFIAGNAFPGELEAGLHRFYEIVTQPGFLLGWNV